MGVSDGSGRRGVLSSRDRVWIPDPEDGVDIRFINPDPKLALFLAERGNTLLSEEAYEWVVEWTYDVGSVLRSRSFMAYTIASVFSGTVLRFIPMPGILR